MWLTTKRCKITQITVRGLQVVAVCTCHPRITLKDTETLRHQEQPAKPGRRPEFRVWDGLGLAEEAAQEAQKPRRDPGPYLDPGAYAQRLQYPLMTFPYIILGILT